MLNSLQRRECKIQHLDEIAKSITDCRDYIMIQEAYALFGISKYAVYRLIRKGAISHVNLGTNQIRVSKQELMKLYPLRPEATGRTVGTLEL